MGISANNTNIGSALQQRMNYLIARQGVVASNIANAHVKGYTAKDISFQDALQKGKLGLRTTQGNHISPDPKQVSGVASTKAFIKSAEDTEQPVDYAEEMLKLNEIQLNYRMVTKLYSKQKSLYKMSLGKSGQ